MNLDHENYYGPEANKAYMSKSQFGSWQECEAATLAELNGEYIPEKSTAVLVGGYIDAALDSPEELEKFKTEHPEMFNVKLEELSDTRQRVSELDPEALTKTGNWKSGKLTEARERFPECFNRVVTLKADFVQAEQIVERCLSDRLFCLLTGNTPETKDHVQRQAILVGKIAGVPFRGKADYLLDEVACRIIMQEFPETAEALGGQFTEGAIVDLKSTKDFGQIFDETVLAKVSWIDYWHYPTQGGIYRELHRQMTGKTLPFVIVAVTKEKATDIGAYYIPHGEMEAALHIVEENAHVYQKIKRGKLAPMRCEKCAYCKATKKLTGIVNYKEA